MTELDEIMTAKWEQGWLRFNVTLAFRRWINRPRDNLGLVITTKSADSGKHFNSIQILFASLRVIHRRMLIILLLSLTSTSVNILIFLYTQPLVFESTSLHIVYHDVFSCKQPLFHFHYFLPFIIIRTTFSVVSFLLLSIRVPVFCLTLFTCTHFI